MKKLISIILCVMLAMSVVACGKKTETKSGPDTVQSETANEDEAKAETKGEADSSAETKVLPQTSANELEDKVNEFNTTEDPERKEELRKELEEFLKQAEEMANQG